MRLPLLLALLAAARAGCMPNVRPPPSTRTFYIAAVEETISNLYPKFTNPDLGLLFSNCLPNTLDTTVYQAVTTPGAEEAFVVTGDITAMWIRDSTNQVTPYVQYAKTDANASALIRGVIRKQASFVSLDPYANSFKLENSALSPNYDDSTSFTGFLGSRINAMGPQIFERKYELDTLVNFLHLSCLYYNATGDLNFFEDPVWIDAVGTVLVTMIEQQISSADEGGNPPYLFQRLTTQPTDSLWNGRGMQAAYTGMIKTGFRPSDDSHVFPFLIPANAYAVVNLRSVALILSALGESGLAGQARTLASQVDAGIQQYGVVTHPKWGKVYAYEVDGFGNWIFMDDGNVPSLLSLPYLGYVTENDSLYLNTRAAVLSTSNPYYYTGSVVSGVGSPHTGPGRVWPMAVMMRALTSNNITEIANCVSTLTALSSCSGLQHESVNTNNAGDYSRPWFAWANSLFGTLILKVAEQYPSIIF